MTRRGPARSLHAAAWLLVAALAALAAPGALAQDAAALRARHAALHDKLGNNVFGRPLALESTQTSGDLRGDVYTVVDHSFAGVQQALQSIENWCDILILHLNVKRCKANPAANTIALNVGRKFDQRLEDAYQLDFDFRVAATGADYLQVQLGADKGPMGTKNYRIVVEAIPLDGKKSVIHMSYAYGYGLAAKLAIKTYLSTIGSKKVGFTSSGKTADGQPVFIGGVLGLLERNTMRYYLAIDAYLSAQSLPPAERVEQRIRSWHASTERYAAQLREMEQTEYLEMKRKEIRRQQG